MPVISSDIKLLLAADRTQTSAAGGRPAWPAQIAVSGQSGAVWSALFSPELTAGVEKKQKLFFANLNAGNLSWQYPELGFFRPPAVSSVKYLSYFFVGTQDGTATDDDESAADYYSVGKLTAPSSASIGNQNWTVDVFATEFLPAGARPIIRAGDLIRIDARATVAGTGNNEVLEVDTITGTSGTTVSFTTTAGCLFAYTGDVYVQTLPAGLSDLAASVLSVDKSGLSGGASTFNATGIVAYNATCPRQSVTLTIETGATTFSASTDIAGWPGGGSMGGNNPIGSAFSPVNTDPAMSGIMFTVPAGAFNGSLTVGDSVVIEFGGALLPFWQRIIVLPAADSGTKTITLEARGQSV
jgi:hypothetical protein